MNVEFNEEEVPVATHAKQKKPSLFTRAVISLKLAKDEAGAQRILLIIACACFAAALLIFINLLTII